MSTRSRARTTGWLVPLAAAALASIVAAPSRALAQDQCDANAGVIYAPGQGVSGLVLFEDLWPSNGDLDFNDQAVAYNYEFLLDSGGDVVTMKATINVLAVGANLHNGGYIHLPLARASTPVTVVDQSGNTITPIATEADLVIPLVNDTRSLFSNQYSYINTEPSTPVESGTPLAFTITFTNGAALDTSASPFDLFIARSNDFTHQIHLPQYRGTDAMDTSLFGKASDGSNQNLSASGGADNTGRWFVNDAGLPFALAIPQLIDWPQEKIAIENVYTDLSAFASSGGTQDAAWYTDTPNINSTLAFTHGASNQLPPAPQSIGADLACGSATVQGNVFLFGQGPKQGVQAAMANAATFSTQTDSNGDYTFGTIPAGSYQASFLDTIPMGTGWYNPGGAPGTLSYSRHQAFNVTDVAASISGVIYPGVEAMQVDAATLQDYSFPTQIFADYAYWTVGYTELGWPTGCDDNTLNCAYASTTGVQSLPDGSVHTFNVLQFLQYDQVATSPTGASVAYFGLPADGNGSTADLYIASAPDWTPLSVVTGFDPNNLPAIPNWLNATTVSIFTSVDTSAGPPTATLNVLTRTGSGWSLATVAPEVSMYLPPMLLNGTLLYATDAQNSGCGDGTLNVATLSGSSWSSTVLTAACVVGSLILPSPDGQKFFFYRYGAPGPGGAPGVIMGHFIAIATWNGTSWSIPIGYGPATTGDALGWSADSNWVLVQTDNLYGDPMTGSWHVVAVPVDGGSYIDSVPDDNNGTFSPSMDTIVDAPNNDAWTMKQLFAASEAGNWAPHPVGPANSFYIVGVSTNVVAFTSDFDGVGGTLNVAVATSADWSTSTVVPIATGVDEDGAFLSADGSVLVYQDESPTGQGGVGLYVATAAANWVPQAIGVGLFPYPWPYTAISPDNSAVAYFDSVDPVTNLGTLKLAPIGRDAPIIPLLDQASVEGDYITGFFTWWGPNRVLAGGGNPSPDAFQSGVYSIEVPSGR